MINIPIGTMKVKVTKKSQPNYRYFLKKTKPEVKDDFLIKKNVYQIIYINVDT